MHPDLSPHLHLEECNILIAKLKDCHNENKFAKFMGACNDIDKAVNKCLKKEREIKRNANRAAGKEKREATLKKIEEGHSWKEL